MTKEKVHHILIFLLGVFVTMPILELNVGIARISIFTILLIFELFFLLISSFSFTQALYNSKVQSFFLVWLLICSLSCFTGYLFFWGNEAWQQASLGYFSKIFIYMVFAILWFGQKNKKNYNSILLRGLLVGAILNIVWATIDAGLFYIFGVSISNIVFRKYGLTHDVAYNTVSLILNNGTMIRSAGFNFDPAHLGFLVPFVIGYGSIRKKYTLIIVGMLGILASASTTALLCSIIVILFSYKLKRIKISSKTIFLMLCIFVLLIILFVSNGSLANTIRYAFDLFKNRVTSTYIDNGSENIRVQYLKYLPIAILELGPMILFGTGFGTASYGYCNNSFTMSAMDISNYPYDMENTYIAYLLDTGILGFVVFIGLLIVLFVFYRRTRNNSVENAICFSLVCSIVFSMIFYHYVVYAVQMIALIACLSNYKLFNYKNIKIIDAEVLPIVCKKGIINYDSF